ncbi:hypothetical protein FRAHR75_690009 [Frankia sp. Hr75.2]|nr:hypothetical protein FRAHR75_690009 [Frankia sp. Hr75.2]
MAFTVVVYDASVLHPNTLRDLLIRIAGREQPGSLLPGLPPPADAGCQGPPRRRFCSPAPIGINRPS